MCETGRARERGGGQGSNGDRRPHAPASRERCKTRCSVGARDTGGGGKRTSAVDRVGANAQQIGLSAAGETPLALASRVKGRTGGGHVCACQITKRSRRAHNLENYLAKVNFEQTCFDRDDRPSVLCGYPRSCPRIQSSSARRLERGQGTAAEAHGCKCIQESAFAGLALSNRPQSVANRRGLRTAPQGTATNVDSRP